MRISSNCLQRCENRYFAGLLLMFHEEDTLLTSACTVAFLLATHNLANQIALSMLRKEQLQSINTETSFIDKYT